MCTLGSNARDNKFIMSIELYSPTPLDRVNPEFIGIAKRHSAYKQKRQKIENQRDHYLRELKYKISVDLNLEKGLEQQRERLRTVKKTHHRRLADQQFKREQQEIRKVKLRSLSTSVKERRDDMKKNVKNALLHVFNRNRRNQNEEKHFHHLMVNKLRNDEHALSVENRRKYQQVKRAERESHEAVNRFYKTLNKESLNAYKHCILEESEKAHNFTSQIKIMENAIEKYDSRIQKKKEKMLNIFQQIEGYTSQSTIDQSKCLPTYLRPTLSLSSHSSRPKDLLLKGVKQSMEPKLASSIN